MRIKGVIRIIGHCIVNIRALVIEELSIGHHSCILKVFAEASSDQMHMNPLYVLPCEGLHIKKLRVL